MYSNFPFMIESGSSSSSSPIPSLPDLNELCPPSNDPQFHPPIDSSHQLNLNLTLSHHQTPFSYYNNNPITDNLPINPPPSSPFIIALPAPLSNNPITSTSKPKIKRNRKSTTTTLKERATALQNLIPWCHKKMNISTTVGEAYKYIQILQAQVNELESEKLNASVLRTSKFCVCCSEQIDFTKDIGIDLSSSDATNGETHGAVTVSKSSFLN